MSGIYIHIPFCRRKCLYCDFYSLGSRGADLDLFVDRVLEEYAGRRGELAEPVRTIYLGGGTPSLLSAPQLERLLAPLLADHRPEEVTLEVNPDDVTTEACEGWRRAGVNRISMGVQSFCDAELRAVGRRHTAAQAEEAAHLLRSRFDNISLDLIYGLPGQTPESWRHSLHKALELHPQHISAYSLTYEEGTPLTILRDRGRISEADEELTLAMYRELVAALGRQGYEHYEISNFALAGCRSRHNSSYWQGLPYLGLGPGAHSYDGRSLRRANTPDLAAYMAGNVPHRLEQLGPEELLEEHLLTRLRTSDGIDMADFARHFGPEAAAKLVKKASNLPPGCFRLTSTSQVGNNNHTLRFTEDGFLVSDALILDLLTDF